MAVVGRGSSDVGGRIDVTPAFAGARFTQILAWQLGKQV